MGHQRRHRADQPDPDPELVEFTGAEPVGGHDRPAEDVHHGLVGRGPVQLVVQPDQLGVELPPHHVPLGLVVAEEGAPADADGGGDLVHRGLVVPLTAEQVERGPGHVLAGRAGSPAPRRHRRIGRASPPAVAVRPSGFHFDIECYKLERPATPALCRPTPGGSMTVTTDDIDPRHRRPAEGPAAGPTGPLPSAGQRPAGRGGPAGRGRVHRRHVRRLLGRPAPPDPVPPLAPPPPPPAPFDGSRPWTLHPQVSLRPESFGALAYHFGTRRLSFLKSRTLLAVVESLADQPTGHDACRAAGVTGRGAGSLRAGPRHAGRVRNDLRAGGVMTLIDEPAAVARPSRPSAAWSTGSNRGSTRPSA